MNEKLLLFSKMHLFYLQSASKTLESVLYAHSDIFRCLPIMHTQKIKQTLILYETISDGLSNHFNYIFY